MTKVLLQAAKIVGTAGGKNWSQVHTFFPQEEEKISQRGQLLAVISLSALTEGIEVAAAGRELISRLHEEYYGDLTAEPFAQLKKALQTVSTEAVDQFAVEIAATSVVGKVLNVAIFGGGKLVIFREGRAVIVLEGEAYLGETKTASGYFQDGDLFCLGTAEFFSLVAEGSLQAALASGSPQEAAETLTPIVHGQEDGGTTAVVIVKIREQDIGEISPKEEEKDIKISLKDRLSLLFTNFSFLIKNKLNKQWLVLLQRMQKTERPKRTLATVALVLLLILGVSVIAGARQRKHLTSGKQIAVLLQQAQVKKEEGEALLGLNPLKAKELLLEAQDIVQKIKPDGPANQKVAEFKQELEGLLAKVLREHRAEPAVFFDLELIKDEAKGDDWDISGEQIIVLDKGKSSIYSLGISDKKSAILAGGEDLGGSTQMVVSGEEIYVLTERGIWGVQLKVKSSKLKIEKDEKWGEIVDIQAFLGNLYLLDKKGEIWKYPAIEGGFGTKQKWLKEAGNFSDVVGMAVDGAVWILKSEGTILKYIRGVKEAFGVAGLSKPFSNPVAAWTDSDQEHLYVLDKGNSRVVVLAKSGEYNSEYVWEGISDVSGILVREKEKKIFLLSGSKIYEIMLR